MRTKTRTLTGALVALAVGLSSCGSNGHVTSGNSPGDTSSWPASLSNSKIAALYGTADSSPAVVNCVPPSNAALQKLIPASGYSRALTIDGVGTAQGPAQSQLVSCDFVGTLGYIDVFLGPVGASTWTDSHGGLTDPSALQLAKVIPGSGSLNLPYTQPDGWRWKLSYTYTGYQPSTALELAHAVADNLAH